MLRLSRACAACGLILQNLVFNSVMHAPVINPTRIPASQVNARSALQTPSICCVLPAYNEALNLGRVVPDILRAALALSPQVEIIVVDDGSRDGTALVMHGLCAAHPQVVYVQLSRNFGKEAALTAGLDAACGDVVVLMDADGQHPSSLLHEMLSKWQHGADVVYAARKTRDEQSLLYARLANVFYALINWDSHVKIPPQAGDFRLLDRKVVNALKALPERNRFMKGLYAWVGFQSDSVEYEPLPRAAGRSKFGLRGGLSLALTGMLAFSTAPLRLMTWLGLLLSCVALGYGAWVVVEYFWFGMAVPGYATIVVSMMLLSGVQLLGMGILAEYVGRIYDEVKQRPAYLVAARTGTSLPPL
jgi:polyisoprenyl-phosphate glycosyltransferase